MKKIAILTDSTAYFPDELLEKYDVHVIPLIVNWNDESYLDNVDITPEVFYDRLTKEKNLPTTSQPSAGAFKEVFDGLKEDYSGIVAILISGELSGTVASALAAAEMMGDFPVEVVDSKLTTMALGLMVIKAAEVAQAGGSLEEVSQVAKDMIGKVTVMFVLDTLEFLHKGGRIGGAKRLLGSMLALKPVLQLQDGKIEAYDSVRTKKKAIAAMLSHFYEDAVGKDSIHATVYHGVAEKEAAAVLAEMKERVELKTSVLTKLSPVLGVHTGPGTVGIAYYFE